MGNLKKNIKQNKTSPLNKDGVSNNAIYPLAFLTSENKLFMKSKTELSADGTPRYIPNPNAKGTYCLYDCIKDYTPIYDKKTLRLYM